MQELPEGWEWKRLKEIAEINSRFEKNSFDDETEVTFLPMRCVEELTGRMDTSIEKKYGEIKTGYTPIQEGDLIFAKITPCIENGKIAIARNLKNGIGFASTEFHTLKFSPDNETKFYFFYLMQEKIRQEAARNMTGSAGQQRVPVTFLKGLKVPVPPLTVQRQLVTLFEQAEAIKRKRQDADALTGTLLQSVFLEMFGDPVSNERGWKWVTLETILKEKGLAYGILKPGDYDEKGIPMLRVMDIGDHGLNSTEIFKVTKKLADQYERTKLHSGDILLAVMATIGRCMVVPDFLEGANVNRALAVLRLNETIDSQYLLFLMKSDFFQNLFLKNKIGSSQMRINLTDLRQFEFPLPPLALQQKFAHIVEDVERIREQQGASGKEIEGLGEGLMQRAFAGELVG